MNPDKREEWMSAKFSFSHAIPPSTDCPKVLRYEMLTCNMKDKIFAVTIQTQLNFSQLTPWSFWGTPGHLITQGTHSCLHCGYDCRNTPLLLSEITIHGSSHKFTSLSQSYSHVYVNVHLHLRFQMSIFSNLHFLES